MSTKLVVSIDGLLISNFNSVVSSRSIDEVILVGTSSQFNNISATNLTSVIAKKDSANFNLSVAFPDSTSTESLDDDFYNWLQENSISFFYDPSLTSLSSSLILTSSSDAVLTSIANDNISDFNTNSISSNEIYTVSSDSGSTFSLGSNFGTKPSIELSSPNFLDDLSDSVSITVSAAKFAELLAANSSTNENITISDPSNLIVLEDNNSYSTISRKIKRNPIRLSDVSEGYDGSNRLSSVLNRTTPASGSRYNYWANSSDIEVSVSQMLMLPLMGSEPRGNLVILKDTAENLSVGLREFSTGQTASFNVVEISDNADLVLDPVTFSKLDRAKQPNKRSSAQGITLTRSDGETAYINIQGTLSQVTNAGIWNGTTIATSLQSDASNLLTITRNNVLTGTISSITDLISHQNYLEAYQDSFGTSSSTNLVLSASFLQSTFSAEDFILLAETDAATSQDLIADYFSSGIIVTDTAENIKDLITSTNSSVIAHKDYIASIVATDASAEKIILSWEEYIGAISGSDFDSTDTSTWTTSSIAFQNLNNIELVVTGKASEINDIIDTYGDDLTDFPTGLTLKILDGEALTLKQAQLDKLDARIDGVVIVSDTSDGISTLLDNAIPTSVQQINSTETLQINFDQFRNLPSYYSSDVILRDTEDNIVDALKEDLLDDRVTTLVITNQSTTLGKDSGEGSSIQDSSLTVTASAAANILSKKVYSSTNYDSDSFDDDSYLDINIVDRGSAIANFIGSATLPGASTAANETGKINFTEKDGGSIELDYNQNLAYEAMSSAGVLATSLTTTPAIAAINLKSLSDAIANAQSSIIDNTENGISTALEQINQNADLIENTGSALTSSIVSAQTSIAANTDAEVSSAQSALTSSIVSAQTSIVADTGATESALTSSIVSAQTSIIADTGATEAAIIADTGATETALTSSIVSAQTSIISNTDDAHTALARANMDGSNVSGKSSELATALTGSFVAASGNTFNARISITNADYSVADLKVINAATTGAIYFHTTTTHLTGSAADLVIALAGDHNFAGNVTINDEAGTNLNAEDLSAIGEKTTGTVTVTNAVNIQGTQAQVTAALVTDETKVVALTATVALDDGETPSITQLNNIAAAAGVVTASLAANSLSNLGALTTASTDQITITVNDDAATNVNAEDLSALGGKTAATVTVSNAVNIQGTTDQVTAALVTDETKVTASTATVELDDGETPSITQLNNIAAAAGVVTASLAANSLSNLGALTTASTDQITITVNDDAATNVNAEDLSALGGKTAATVTVSNAVNIVGTQAQLTAALFTGDTKVTASSANVTLDSGSNFTIDQFDQINSAVGGTIAYTISDTAANITTANNAAASKFNNATALTVVDDGGSTGSTLNLNNATTTNLTSATITGDAGADVVQLSSALTSSNIVTMDFVSDDGDAQEDKLIFNLTDSSDYITFDSDGNVITGGGRPTAFTFNKFSNFDLASGEDKFGIFYDEGAGAGAVNATGPFLEISITTPSPAYRLRDGIVYEDSFNSEGDILSSTALNASAIRANIGSFINTGGTASASGTGSDDLDFTYVLYARSSSTEDANSVQSAYIYSGTYSGQNQGTNSFDASKLSIIGLAEIVGVTEGDLQDAFITTNPF